jgi:xanthine/uracil permease
VAVLWAAAIVPAAMGFWLVAGSLAGVPHARIHTLLAGALLALGLATLLQVGLGFRLPMYEGPASAYLAAIGVVAGAGHHGLGAITGGLLSAGIFVAGLGVLRVDRLMVRFFTPLVARVFPLVVILAVLPATLERAVGATHGLPGSGSAWAATLVVVGTVLAMRRLSRLTPYVMLCALVAGTAIYFVLDGVPHSHVAGGLAGPPLLPWGAPNVQAGVVFPFVLAGALAALNTIASGTVMSVTHDLEVRPGAARTSFLMHGAALAGGALVGNLVGNVSRLESPGIVRLLGHLGRAPLLFMGVALGALAFVRPVVDLAAMLPLSVSAALLAVLLGVVVVQALEGIREEPPAVRWLVVAPSLIPSAIWIVFGSSMGALAQLLANPMLWGVLLAMGLERIVRRRLIETPPTT